MNPIEEWESKGRPIPAPGEYKIVTVLEYAKKYNIKTFIETGSFIGSTINGVKEYFEDIHSIELSPKLFSICLGYFQYMNNIHLYNGESEKILPMILQNIDNPCVFWLDSHYSAGVTARGTTSSSLHAEIPAILGHHIKNHIILVDDTYDLFDADGYLSPGTIKKMILEKLPNYEVTIEGYILRAYPK